MKFFFILPLLIILNSCSFDQKTGIWKNENVITNDKKVFEGFDTLSSLNEPLNKEIPIKKNFKFRIIKPVKNFEWKDIFYEESNNLDNFSYSNLNKLIFKSKKLSRSTLSNKFLFNENLIISTDIRGNIIIYSINDNKVLKKINFYKNKYKRIKKILNIIFENNIIYISDNIGYMYAFDIQKDRFIWAKNYNIPFRSNLKLSKNKILGSDQNNNFYFVDKSTGKLLKSVPTEETSVNNVFQNNLSKKDEDVYFLNTYGSLYSFNIKEMKLNWFINLNQSLDLNPSNIFFGGEIISKDKIIVSSKNFTYIINSINGAVEIKKNFSFKIKPIIYDKYIFLVTNQNFLISMNLKNGEIIYAYNFNELIAKYLNKKIKSIDIKKIMILNNDIFILSMNNNLYKLNLRGNVKEIKKLPSKAASDLIFIDDTILYLNNDKKLIIIN